MHNKVIHNGDFIIRFTTLPHYKYEDKIMNEIIFLSDSFMSQFSRLCIIFKYYIRGRLL
jgi:hypothetical protein